MGINKCLLLQKKLFYPLGVVRYGYVLNFKISFDNVFFQLNIKKGITKLSFAKSSFYS